MIYTGAVYVGTQNLKGRFFGIVEVREHEGGEIVDMIHPRGSEHTDHKICEDFIRVAARFHANKNKGVTNE